MATALGQIRTRLRTLIRGRGDRNASRIRRQHALANFAWRTLPALKVLLIVVGYVWMIALPFSSFGQKTYIDENALQPGQVTTYWDWDDVHRADQYLAQLEGLHQRNASSTEFAFYLQDEFRKIGLPSAIQNYSFQTSLGTVNGTNAYATMHSPRASGTEAMIISASKLSSVGNGSPNLRGIASVLSLASFLRGYSLWSKDLIFVISDGYLEGMQAWITAYHEAPQSNLRAEPIALPSGVVWTAVNIDYPGHSFSHLGIFFEGLNGRLPNQDLLNCFQVISRHTGGVPVTVYDHIDHHEFPEAPLAFIPRWAPQLVKKSEEVLEYIDRARNIVRHVGYQARGQPSGVHGLLHQFRIDAFTVFAVPAHGPHGFHAIGRVIESTLRTMNNLLERLHASFFFYLLVGTTTFMKIGSYLPTAVLVGTAMLFSGLGHWVEARWVSKTERADHPEKGQQPADARSPPAQVKWLPRRRHVLPALSIQIMTHFAGVALFYVYTRPWFLSRKEALSPLAFVVLTLAPLTALLLQPSMPEMTAPNYLILKSLNLCFASMVISIISVLNFSLAAALAVALGLPLLLSTPSSSLGAKLSRYAIYAFLGLGWLIARREDVANAVWNWEFLGVWFAPFVCIVYTPLMLQAGIVCLMPPESSMHASVH